MKTTLSERDGNTVKFTVEISSEEVQEAFDARLKQLAREARIPGFRPGKAPAVIVRQRVGDEAILMDAVEESMAGWFSGAVAQLGVDPVDMPEIKLDDELPAIDKPLGFTATVTVMPEVVLGEYKGVEASREPVEVEDSEVDAQLERLRNDFAELRPVTNRAAQKGDFITADLGATLDGEVVESLQANDFLFEIGGERVLPQVEEQAVGLKPDEERTFPLQLPDDFPEELAGKTVDFTIKVKDIKEKELPPLTDKWASEISEFATLLELRQEIRNRIRTTKEQLSEQRFAASAIQAAADNAELDLPEVVIQAEAEEMVADFRRSLEARGVPFEYYLEATGMPEERVVEDMKPRAANNVKTRLVLDAIARVEGLEATEDEVAAIIEQMATATQTDLKALEKELRKSGRIQAIREQIMRDKAADLIVTSAVAVAPEPAESEAAGAESEAAGAESEAAGAESEAAGAESEAAGAESEAAGAESEEPEAGGPEPEAGGIESAEPETVEIGPPASEQCLDSGETGADVAGSAGSQAAQAGDEAVAENS